MNLRKVWVLPFIVLFTVLLGGCAKQVESISLDKNTIDVVHGETFTLTAKIAPDDAQDQSIKWNIVSDNVKAVTDENTIKKEFFASGVGKSSVSVISANGKKANCVINITENADDIAARAKAEEEARIAAEKKAEEERIAKEKAEEEERKGYETGITYDQLARTPDEYKNKKVKFYGKVVQVIEGNGETKLRIATKSNSYGGYYDDVVLVYYNSSLTSSRVLEDDMITIYGISQGLYSYESTMGGNITVPLIAVKEIKK